MSYEIENDEAFVIGQEAMNLRSTKILCKIASEMAYSTVNRLLNGMNSASFDLNVFSSAMHRPKDC